MAEKNIVGLAHIGVRVKDMDASVKFYTEVLGFTLDHRQLNGSSELSFLSRGNCPLELIWNPSYKDKELLPGQVDHVALEVTGIDALFEELKGKGVTFLSENVSDCPGLLNGVKNIFFLGPDGERLEFFEYYK